MKTVITILSAIVLFFTSCTKEQVSDFTTLNQHSFTSLDNKSGTWSVVKRNSTNENFIQIKYDNIIHKSTQFQFTVKLSPTKFYTFPVSVKANENITKYKIETNLSYSTDVKFDSFSNP